MDFSPLAERYAAHETTLRGVARHALIARQVAQHLPPPPARIVDIGGGTGAQSIPLARLGHEITLVDPSAEMLQRARQALEVEDAAVTDRVRLLQMTGEDAPHLLGAERFEVVLCHGVIMYVEDEEPLIRAMVALARPGGIISLVTKNRDALAMRPALEGRYRDALDALQAESDRGRLGVTTRAHALTQVARWLGEAGAEVTEWYGVRVFTDHLGDRPPGAEIDEILELEWAAGRQDPYRQVARLIHAVAQRHA